MDRSTMPSSAPQRSWRAEWPCPISSKTALWPRSASSSRSPPPQQSNDTSSESPESCSSTRSTSTGAKTTGNRPGRRARTSPDSSPIGRPITRRYRNCNAFSAWFCVLADTFASAHEDAACHERARSASPTRNTPAQSQATCAVDEARFAAGPSGAAVARHRRPSLLGSPGSMRRPQAYLFALLSPLYPLFPLSSRSSLPGARSV